MLPEHQVRAFKHHLGKTIIFLSFPEPFPGSFYGYLSFGENIDEIFHSVSLTQFARDQGYR